MASAVADTTLVWIPFLAEAASARILADLRGDRSATVMAGRCSGGADNPWVGPA
jgi:hypothetical protein